MMEEFRRWIHRPRSAEVRKDPGRMPMYGRIHSLLTFHFSRRENE